MRRMPTLLPLALILAGCGSNRPIAQAPQAVQTQHLRSDLAVAGGRLRFSAVVVPDARVPLSFRVPGYVVALKRVRGQDGRMRDLAEGDRVRGGTVLVRIRSAEYEDKVRQASSQAAAAEALAQKARLDFDRATRLYGSQSITKPEFDNARAQLDATQGDVQAARAQTSEAQVSLGDTSIWRLACTALIAYSLLMGIVFVRDLRRMTQSARSELFGGRAPGARVWALAVALASLAVFCVQAIHAVGWLSGSGPAVFFWGLLWLVAMAAYLFASLIFDRPTPRRPAA